MPPVNLLIKPASALCNMRCRYCFYADVSENRESRSLGMMSLETLEQTVRRAFEYADGFAGFAFQGGEPTLAGLPFFEALLAFQKKYNTKNIPVHNSIQTNGYLIDEQWAKFFADNHFLVGLSIDGTKEAHDSLRLDAAGEPTFDRAVRAAQLLRAHRVEFNILCVVSNFVARHPLRVYEQLKPYGFLQFIACLDGFDGEKAPWSLTNDRYAAFLRQTFELYHRDFLQGRYVSIRNFDNYIRILMGNSPENCAMNGQCTCYCVVEGDGSVYPCDFYVLDEWKLGTVADNSLSEMIGSGTAARFVDGSRYVSEECRSCRYLRLCRGGCRREREPFTDGKPSLNRLCPAFRTFFDAELPKMLEIASILHRQQMR
ncbi:MAG: anaerobic sulfatase maturase [Clostridia bacterium]|nr:anaerobic sulfatase maturase [Clostridia bacterium]